MAGKQKSDWIDRKKPPCKACGGTGSAGKDGQGRTIACPSCRGFGN